MVWPVVKHVAALAETLEIAPPVIARVVIEVRRRQDNTGSSQLCGCLEVRPPRRPASAIPPSATGRIEPTSIGQTPDCLSMRPAASLTNPGGALETDSPADLRQSLG
jgi:hypothetical protein